MANAIDYFNMALAHASGGQLDRAQALFQEAVRQQPDFVEAHNNLGTLFLQQGKLEEAIRHYRQALQHRPDYADAESGLGSAFATQGRWNEAAIHFRNAIRLRPGFAAAHCNLANVLRSLGSLDEAVSHCHQALRIQPNFAEAHDSLGSALLAQGKVQEAVARFQQALQLQPGSAAAHSNLGSALHQLGRAEEAEVQFQQALWLQPNLAEAHCNLGNAYYGQGKLDLALASFQQTLRLAPDHAQAHKGRAFVWLLRGDFENGWREFEWRWAQPGFVPRTFTQPLWDGSGLNGRTLLLYAEHGLGDTFQFIRYASEMSRQRELAGEAKVFVECQPHLLPLLATVPGVDGLVGRGDALPAFDVRAPLLSVPRILRTTLDNVPNAVPYLHADPKLTKHWRRELTEGRGTRDEGREARDEGRGKRDDGQEGKTASDLHNSSFSSLTPNTSPLTPRPWSLVPLPSPLTPFRIGICWQGDPTYYHDRVRSIPLAQFAPLAQMPGIRLVSLQKGPGTEQLSRECEVRTAECDVEKSPHSALRAPHFALRALELDETSGAFMDTAALMHCLDLVISSDTAICHLAGALGVPVWVALPSVPDWRWLLDREDCPWYPTMRLFRQSRCGQWEDVFQRMAEELKQRTKAEG